MASFSRIPVLASLLALASCTTAPVVDRVAPTARPAQQASIQDGALAQADAAGTQQDEVDWRYEMEGDGEPANADDFDAWMERKDVNVATGTPAGPATDDCAPVEGNGASTGESPGCPGE